MNLSEKEWFTQANRDYEREVERAVGINFFSTSETKEIGGIYKDNYKDFIVKEITEDGQVLEIREDSKNYAFSQDDFDKYTTFNLIKVNKDTFEAIDLICRELNIHPAQISYSGLKDKTSISVQKVSIKGNYVEQLRTLKIRDIFIRDIYPSKKGVKLGSHWGNHFVITLRQIEDRIDLSQDIDHLFYKLTKVGFPNYFGLQRFGTFRPNSHLIGRYLIEKNYKLAFDEFVTSIYPMESESAKKARSCLKETGDYKRAFEIFPQSLHYEKRMLQYMMDHPQDYEGAFKVLPDDLIKLIVSAFQSYIFNKILSLREKKGISLFTPVKGDVFCILEQKNGWATLVKYLFGSYYDEWLLKAMEKNRAAIVVPIIGYDIDLNSFPLMKQLFEEVVKEEQIRAELFSKSVLEDLELKGALRTMMVKPVGLQILEFKDDDIYSGFKKLKFEFSLSKGSYATMLLREFPAREGK